MTSRISGVSDLSPIVIYAFANAGGLREHSVPVGAGLRHILFAREAVTAPSPWEVVLLPPALWPDADDPGRALNPAFLPVHRISIGMRGAVTLPEAPLALLVEHWLAGRDLAVLSDPRGQILLRRDTPAMRALATAWRQLRHEPDQTATDHDRLAREYGIIPRPLPSTLLCPGAAILPLAEPAPVPALRGYARRIRGSQAAPVAEVTVLTPTGDRLAAFARCAHIVQCQTIRPRCWLIVDDGSIPVESVIPLPAWARVIRRQQRPDDPPHTLSVNLQTALPGIGTDKVVIMEDDDWYAPEYLATMRDMLDHADLVGLNHIHYYHLRGNSWKTGTPPAHTALAQTAFRLKTAGETLARLCDDPGEEIRQIGVVDRHWWHGFEGRKLLMRDHPHLHLGLKGGWGRAGLASGHDAAEVDYIPDTEGQKFSGILGEDHVFYHRLRRFHAGPDHLVIYTAQAPGKPPPPAPLADVAGLDLVLFTTTPEQAPAGWQTMPLDQAFLNPSEDALKPFILPHLYFPDCDWSLWLDPSVFLMDDPTGLLHRIRQDQKARIATFSGPEGPDMRVLLRAHNDPRVMRVMLRWWHDRAVGLSDAMLGAEGLKMHGLGAEGLAGHPALFLPLQTSIAPEDRT